MSGITALSKSVFSPPSEVNVLFDSLSKNKPITPEQAATLEQINVLEHAGHIPSKEALLLKNNLDNELFAEGILSDLTLDLVKQGKLAPEMKCAAEKRKLQGAILFLYTCHLEQINSTLKPYILQQQIWKDNPTELLVRMKRAEEMESKEYLIHWLSSLNYSKQECQTALDPLLKPLENAAFKDHFLKFLETLQSSEEDLVHRLCLEELHDLLKTKSGPSFFLAASQFLKASSFYQKHLQDIGTRFHQDHQFSLCLAADMIKNAPHVKALPTYYSFLYGLIKKQWEHVKGSSLKKPVVLIEGPSSDEKAISHTLQKLFEKTKQPFYKIEAPSLKEDSKKIIQSLLKNAPYSLVAAISPEHQGPILKASKKLDLPLTFFPPHTEVSKWEETSSDPYPHFRIAFPTPLNSEVPEEIHQERTRIAGIPGLFTNSKTSEQLKKEWGFSPHTKVVVVDTPEGDSPWPSYIANEYRSSQEITLVVVTDAKNKDFVHSLKTKISPHTDLPIKIYTALSPLEREELFTLADLVVGKEREDHSSLLFETSHAKTPLLLDHCSPPLFSGGLFSFLSKIPSLFSFKKESFQTKIHEKLLTDQGLGIMIRSKENFKLSFEELLFQETPLSSPKHLAETLPSLMKEMEKESQDPHGKKLSLLDPQIFKVQAG